MSTFETTLNSAQIAVGRQGVLRSCLLVLAGSLALILSARIQIPMWPVPVTLQDVTVLVLAAWMGSRLGTLTVILYLAQGGLGLPVFANPPYGGWGYFAGPTAGYLIGFAVAAWVVGTLFERGWSRSVSSAMGIFAIGMFVIFGLGFVWMASLVGTSAAFLGGVQPFVLAGLAKVLVAAVLIHRTRFHTKT